MAQSGVVQGIATIPEQIGYLKGITEARLWAKVLAEAFEDLRQVGPLFLSAVVFFFGTEEESSFDTAITAVTLKSDIARARARAIIQEEKGVTPEKVLAEVRSKPELIASLVPQQDDEDEELPALPTQAFE